MTLNIRFLGGASTVTGSKYCIEHDGKRLLVDCGLFQGYKQLRLRNCNPLPTPAADFYAVILTHAHLDHSGYVPLLVRQGFKGRVHATSGTRDLCAILLPDSGHIQEEDAFFANKHGYSKHEPALPLYTKSDALNSLRQFHVEQWGHWFEPIKGWKAQFSVAGHILGASSLLLEVAGRGGSGVCCWPCASGFALHCSAQSPRCYCPCFTRFFRQSDGNSYHRAVWQTHG